MNVALVVLAVIVALVALDALLDTRKPRGTPEDPAQITAPKIVVDLSGRDRD